MSVTIQVRRDTAATWTAANPVLFQGEWGLESDTLKIKIGDGVTAWASLAYFAGSGFANPMTLLGDLIDGGASGVAQRLAGPTSGGMNVLTSTPSVGVAQLPAWQSAAALGLLPLVPTAIKTSAYSAVPFDFVPVDVTGGNVTVTLPTAPAALARIGVKLVHGAGVNTVTVACGGSDQFNDDASTSGTLRLLNQGITCQYVPGTPGIWYVLSDDLPLSQLDLRYLALAGGTMTGHLAPAVVTLTDAATIAVNAALGNQMRVTLGGNRTIGAPSNPVDGQTLTLELIQDGTGSRTVTWTSGAGGYTFGSGSAPMLSTAAHADDMIGFRYSAAALAGAGAWCYLGAGLGN